MIFFQMIILKSSQLCAFSKEKKAYQFWPVSQRYSNFSLGPAIFMAYWSVGPITVCSECLTLANKASQPSPYVNLCCYTTNRQTTDYKHYEYKLFIK